MMMPAFNPKRSIRTYTKKSLTTKKPAAPVLGIISYHGTVDEIWEFSRFDLDTAIFDAVRENSKQVIKSAVSVAKTYMGSSS
jgi:hypothetical protein